MSEFSKTQLKSNLEGIIKILMSLGVYVKVGSDFEDFAELCNRTRDKGAASPAFNPDFTNINADSGMWVAGYTSDGQVIGIQAIKTLDLDGKDLPHYLTHNLADIQIGGLDVDADASDWRLSPAASKISGTVTYHGEVWLAKHKRGGCVATLMSRLILIMGYLRWEPDYMIGIQAIKTACGGLGIKQGYMRIEQRFIDWTIRDRKDPIEGWLVWMNNEDAGYNLRIPPETFFDLYEEPAEEKRPLRRATSKR